MYKFLYGVTCFLVRIFLVPEIECSCILCKFLMQVSTRFLYQIFEHLCDVLYSIFSFYDMFVLPVKVVTALCIICFLTAVFWSHWWDISSLLTSACPRWGLWTVRSITSSYIVGAVCSGHCIEYISQSCVGISHTGSCIAEHVISASNRYGNIDCINISSRPYTTSAHLTTLCIYWVFSML